MLEEKDRVMGYWNSPVDSEGAHGNLTPCADPNIDNLSESVDENDGRDFDGASGWESTQRVSVKWKLQGLRDECRTKKRKVPTNVAEMVELGQELSPFDRCFCQYCTVVGGSSYR